MTSLELRVPPLVLLGLAIAAIWLIDATVGQQPNGQFLLGGFALLSSAVGALVALSGVIAFRRAATTVDPRDPARTSRVVSNGIYRYTRNPMYVGFVLVALAAALWFAEWAGFAIVAVLAAYLTRFQIIPEERSLATHFGPDYSAYCARTRRWI